MRLIGDVKIYTQARMVFGSCHPELVEGYYSIPPFAPSIRDQRLRMVIF
jgi:hypothetical protein